MSTFLLFYQEVVVAKEFGLSFIDPQSQQEIVVRGEFSDSEWRILVAFASYAEDIQNTLLFQDRTKVYTAIAWDREAGFIDNSVLPERSEVAEFIHSIRPIFLHSEETNFLRVRGIVAKKTDHPYPRHVLHQLRQHYLADPIQTGWNLSLGELPLNSEEALNIWLYGYEYHRDPEKRAEIEKIHGGPPGNASKSIFLTLLIHKAEAAIVLAGLIRAMEKGGGTEFGVQFR
jgi:hypothetical protein